MNKANGISIKASTDPLVFDKAAAMMAGTDPWKTLGMDGPRCRLAFEGPGKEIYIAFAGEEIAGFVVLQITGSFRGYIQILFVSESFRGQGLGTRLLYFCEERTAAFSPNLFICVSDFNTGALKLYLNYGFEKIGEIPDFIKKGYSEYLLRKTSGPLLDFIPPVN